MPDTHGAVALFSDIGGYDGLGTRRSLSAYLANGTTRPFGSRCGRRRGAGGVPTVSGTTISIPPGAAVVDAQASGSDAPFPVSWTGAPTLTQAPADSTNPRIDIVYVQVVEVLGAPTTQTITFGYRAGNASSTPVPPTTLADGTTPVTKVAVLGYLTVPPSGGGDATVTPGPEVVASGGILPLGSGADYPTNPARGDFVDDPVHGLRRFNGAGAWGNPDPRGEVLFVANTSGGDGTPSGFNIVSGSVAVVAGRRYRVFATVFGNMVTGDSPTTRLRLDDSTGGYLDGTKVFAIDRGPIPVTTGSCLQLVGRFAATATATISITANVAAAANALRVPIGGATLSVDDIGRGG